MSEIDILTTRISELEERVGVLVEMIDHFASLIYDERFMGKIDKIVKHGKDC